MTPTSTLHPAPVWNAADYAANSSQQQAWGRELIAGLKLRGDERVLDVGCGDGKVTAEIARALPRGSTVGIDASPQMIEFARTTFPKEKVSNLEFRVMDARKIRFEPSFDLVRLSDRPLLATIGLIMPEDKSQQWDFALADRCFAAAYFRKLGLA